MLWQILNSIGYSEKEAKVYISLLQLGPQPASIIAQKSNLNRSSCYHTLQELSKKGLVSTHTQKSIQYYSAASPEKILDNLESEEQKIISKKRKLNQNLNKLNDLKPTNTVIPKIQFFTGFEGLKTAYQDTLTAETEILSFGGVEQMPPEVSQYIFKHYVPERIKRGIKIKIITPDEPKIYEFRNKNHAHLRELKVSPMNLDLKIEINIYNQKVAFMSYGDGDYSGVIIENNKISDALRKIHLLLWQLCKKY
jgi:sugar-specific transcriptional regulator TrmB